MKPILDSLLECKRFHFADLKLHVVPKMNSITLVGLVELKKYEPVPESEGGEKAAWEGAYAKQIRAALRETAANAELAGQKGCMSVVADVKTRPSSVMGFNAAFEFQLTQRFETEGWLVADLARFEKDASVSESFWPLDKAWVRRHSGEPGAHEHGDAHVH